MLTKAEWQQAKVEKERAHAAKIRDLEAKAAIRTRVLEANSRDYDTLRPMSGGVIAGYIIGGLGTFWFVGFIILLVTFAVDGERRKHNRRIRQVILGGANRYDAPTIQQPLVIKEESFDAERVGHQRGPARLEGAIKKVLIFLGCLFGLAILVTLASGPSTPTGSTATSSEPDEPCRVEAPVAARAAAQNWCGGGVFTLVNVSNDANNFVVLLQFSTKGQRSWTNGKYTVLNRFRQLTNEMVEKTDMNVAFSLHDTNGQMLGGCARKRGARESTCN